MRNRATILNNLDRLAFLSQPWLGHLLCIGLGILAVIWYQYRMINLDGAVYSLELTLEEGFMYPHGRYGAILTQLIPLGLIKLGASLKVVLIGYSLSFAVINYLAWAFCHYVARQPRAAWVIILFQLLALNATYFWPVSEAFQALIYAIVFYAWITGAKQKRLHWYLLPIPVMLLLTLFTHPVALIPLLVLLAYHVLDFKKGDWIQYAALGGVFLVSVLVWRWLKAPMSEYEAELMPKPDQIGDLLRHFRSQAGYIQMKSYVWHENPLLLWLSGGVMLGLLWSRQWLKALLFFAAGLGYLLVIGIVYYRGESYLIIENICNPFALFPIVFLTQDVLRKLRWPLLQAGILALLLITFSFRIADQKAFLDYKKDWLEDAYQYSQRTGHRSITIDENQIDPALYGIRWASAVETTLYGAVRGADKTFQVYAIPDRERFREKPAEGVSFLFTPYWQWRAAPDGAERYYNFQLEPPTDLPDGIPR